ncbi:MAG: hypothetical protein K6G90_04890 [Clostridia bacterium]|nr:hypothetical protein [Clostridia bacterium]
MATRILTDVELRAHWTRSKSNRVIIEPDTVLTPAAKDFIREQGLETVYLTESERGPDTMTRTPIPRREGKPVYVNAATGMEQTDKGEIMTHLRGNMLVPKTDLQIAFRGKLDSLQAKIMETQVIAEEEKKHRVTADLEELLAFVRTIVSAEVRDEPLKEIKLLNMGSVQIRRDSQNVKAAFGIDHPVPSYRMGKLCVSLNALRTQVRETELAAAHAFTNEHGCCSRLDIIEALNRLSSCVYIILCRTLSEK